MQMWYDPAAFDEAVKEDKNFLLSSSVSAALGADSGPNVCESAQLDKNRARRELRGPKPVRYFSTPKIP